MKNFKLSDYMPTPQGKIAKRMIYKDPNVAAFVLNISKGSTLPDHTHFNCTVLVQVLNGRGQAVIDKKPIPVNKGDLIQVEGQEKLSVENNGEDTLSLYVTLSPNPPSEHYTTDVDI